MPCTAGITAAALRRQQAPGMETLKDSSQWHLRDRATAHPGVQAAALLCHCSISTAATCGGGGGRRRAIAPAARVAAAQQAARRAGTFRQPTCRRHGGAPLCGRPPSCDKSQRSSHRGVACWSAAKPRRDALRVLTFQYKLAIAARSATGSRETQG